MRDDPDCSCYVSHLIAEHRRLHYLLRQMQIAIASSIGPDEQPSFAPVQRALTQVRQELTRHFAEEEDGGCLDEAVSLCPRLVGEAKRIEDEHPLLLADLDGLIARSQTSPATHPNQLTLQRDFDRLCQQLREHEKAENRLLSQAFGVTVNGDESGHAAQAMDV
jgi:hemerythrin HHE cation binding domain-containing protein